MCVLVSFLWSSTHFAAVRANGPSVLFWKSEAAPTSSQNIWSTIINICTVRAVCEYDCSLCFPAQVLQQHPVFLQQNAVVCVCVFFFFFFLLQFWKSSHSCCIDTPVEGPGEESAEPRSPATLSLTRSSTPCPPPHTTLHLPHYGALNLISVRNPLTNRLQSEAVKSKAGWINFAHSTYIWILQCSCVIYTMYIHWLQKTSK